MTSALRLPPGKRASQGEVSEMKFGDKRPQKALSEQDVEIARNREANKAAEDAAKALAKGGTARAVQVPPRPKPGSGMSVDEVVATPPTPMGHVVATPPRVDVEKTEVEKDSGLIDITLPSNFHFYPYKSIAVRTVRADAQAKFVRAAREARMRHLVDAISSLLPAGMSAYDLTVPDFYFIMYWERMNSYSKAPYVHRTTCENVEHIRRVLEGDVIDGVVQKMDEKTLEISTVISKSRLKETTLDIEAIKLPSFNDQFPVTPCRMRDVVEISELADEEGYEDIEWLVELACYLEPMEVSPGQYQSVLQRVEIAKILTPDQVDELTEYIQSVTGYGIQEQTNVRCNGCGAEMVSNVTIDALSFLPSPRRKLDP